MTKMPESDPKDNVRKAPAGSGGGSVVGDTKLGSAMAELHRQHPIAHDNHGPHHGNMDHDRHEMLGGLRPAGK